LTLTVSTLRRFRNTLTKTIDAWDSFERNEILIFNPIGWEALQPRWNGLLAGTRKSVDELRTFRVLLEQKLELFNNMKDSVSQSNLLGESSQAYKVSTLQMVNASVLKESAVATRQGNYITLLTRMTVVCAK